MTAFIFPFIIVAGALQALGNAMNACLRKQLVNPWLAATASFIPIVVVFTLLFFAIPSPLPNAASFSHVHWYDALGGIAGAVAVFAGLLLVDEVGSGAFNGLVIAGNVLASLALDASGALGLHGIGFRPVAWGGGIVLLAGVAIVSRDGAKAPDDGGRRGGAALLFPLIFCAGVLQAIGAALNAELRSAVSNPWLAADVSFVAVTLVFLTIFIVRPSPLPTAGGVAGVRWWMPLAGITGAVAVFAGLVLIDAVGAGTFNGLTITANLLASLALDHFGLLGMRPRAFGTARAIGCALMIAGVVLVSRAGP